MNSHFFSKSVILFSCFILTSCVSVTPPQLALSSLRNEESKNYKLNDSFKVNVGDPIIVRKSYWYQIDVRDDRAVASKDFKITVKLALARDFTHIGRKGEELRIVGSTKVQGREFFIVRVGQISGGGDAGALVDKLTGRVSKTGVGQNAFGSWVTTAVSGVVTEPPDVVFSPSESILISKSKPYENYEIVYTGRLGENITFVYREFTPDNLARPAFFQNLSYNLSEAKTIRFRKLQIEVIDATNEQVSVKVISDS
jgi:hypothetical protein